jgi:CMP-N-acetylneuraminic acid synthetase
MLEGRSILAVVPARSGSRGIPDKNMRALAGTSLIGWAGRVLAQAPFVDQRIITTDSPAYAEEGKRAGLDAPFLRPAVLSTDTAGASETVRHALLATEEWAIRKFEIVLIVEPSSPLRWASDLERVARRLIESGADSVVSVSRLPSKAHPRKVFRMAPDGELSFYEHTGRVVESRQSLEPLFWRDGVCYAVTRPCLVEQNAVIGRRAIAEMTPHPAVNIDEPWELAWAESMVAQGVFEFKEPRMAGAR